MDLKSKSTLMLERKKDSKFFKVNAFSEAKNITKILKGSFKYVTDSVASYPSGFCAEKNNLMYKIFQRKIQKLHESGFVHYHYRSIEIKTARKEIFIPHNIEREEVEPLKIIELKAGFFIWLIAVLCCILLFITENFIFVLAKKMIYLKKLKMTKKQKINKPKNVKRIFVKSKM